MATARLPRCFGYAQWRVFRDGRSASTPLYRLKSVATERVESAQNAAAGVPGQKKLSFADVISLIRQIDQSDIAEAKVELAGAKFSIVLRKASAVCVETTAVPDVYPFHFQSFEPYTQISASEAAIEFASEAATVPLTANSPAVVSQDKQDPAARTDGLTAIASPMSGMFYRCPAPGEPEFVKRGDVVRKGDTIGIIEAMKLMNEIEAEFSGTVVDVLVENGQPVVSGQALLYLKP